MRRAILGLATVAAAFAVAASTASATTTLVTAYNAAYSGTLPGNLPSVGAEAYSFNELGDQITFATSTPRRLGVVRVTMSSWACEQGNWYSNDCVTTPGDKFSVPITLNIYNQGVANGDGTVTPGTLITTITKTFYIPYRPTANLQHCNSGNGNLGKWWKKSTNTCFNGKAANITYNLKPLGLTLPDKVVLGIAYNTTHYGYHPIGESAPCYGTDAGCPYDSLNIGLGTGGTIVGTKQYPGTLFQNAAYQTDYCDSAPAVGVFNLDSPTSACWAGFDPAFLVKTY